MNKPNICRGDLAKQYFEQGYNCSQAVVLAFADVVNVDKETLLKLSSTFGGGMGRLRETCGTVSGMAIVLGLLQGYSTPDVGSTKADLYQKVQSLCLQFEKQNGSLVCRQLLGLTQLHDQPIPTPRTATFYQNRPCGNYVYTSAKILQEYLKENKIIDD